MVLEAVKQDWCALKFASAELKGDKEVVLEAVKKDGCALNFASAELKESLPAYVEASLQAHRDLAFVLHGARPQPAPAAEEPQAQACHMQELPLQMIMHHGYYHGIVLKRFVADFAGVSFGHAVALRRDAARNMII